MLSCASCGARLPNRDGLVFYPFFDFVLLHDYDEISRDIMSIIEHHEQGSIRKTLFPRTVSIFGMWRL